MITDSPDAGQNKLAHYETVLSEFGYQFGEWFLADKHPETEQLILNSYPALLDASDTHSANVTFSQLSYEPIKLNNGEIHDQMKQTISYLGYPIGDIFTQMQLLRGTFYTPSIYFYPLERINAQEWKEEFMGEFKFGKYGTERKLYIAELAKGLSQCNIDRRIRLENNRFTAYQQEDKIASDVEVGKTVINIQKLLEEKRAIKNLAVSETLVQNKELMYSDLLTLNITGNDFEAARRKAPWELSPEDIQDFATNVDIVVKSCVAHHDMFQAYADAGYNNKQIP